MLAYLKQKINKHKKRYNMYNIHQVVFTHMYVNCTMMTKLLLMCEIRFSICRLNFLDYEI